MKFLHSSYFFVHAIGLIGFHLYSVEGAIICFPLFMLNERLVIVRLRNKFNKYER